MGKSFTIRQVTPMADSCDVAGRSDTGAEKPETLGTVLRIPDEDGFKLMMYHKRSVAKISLFVGMPLLSAMAIKNFIKGDYFMAVSNCMMVLILILFGFLIIRRIKEESEYKIYSILFRLFNAVFALSLLYDIGFQSNFSRIEWCYIYPILVFLAVGIKEGAIWVSVFYGMLAFLIFNLDLQEITLSHIQELRSRFLVSFFAVCMLSLFLEHGFRRGQQRLLQHQGILKESENRYRQAYEQLNIEMQERKRMEAQLLNAAQQWRTTFDGISDIVCLLDSQGKILRCNKAMASLLGKPFHEIINHPHWEIIHGTLTPVKECPVERMLETRRRENDVHLINDRCFSSTVDPLLDKEGHLIGAVHIMSDITDRKQTEKSLRESEDLYRDLVEFSQYMILTHDLTGQILSINQGASKLLGYDQGLLLKMNIRDLLAPEVRDGFEEYLNTIRTAGAAEGLMKVQTAAGEKRIVAYNNTLRTEGVTSPIVRAMAYDITDRVKAEKEIRRLSQENAIMAEIGRIISSTLNIEEVYDLFAEQVRKLIPFDRIVINTINVEKGTVINVYIAGKGITDRKVVEVYPLKGSGNAEMVRTNSTLLIQTEDFAEYKDRFPMLLSTFQAGFRSIMNVPLFSKGQIIGGLLLRSFKPYVYTDKDVRLAERIGDQIAGAIANAQLFSERKEAEEALLESEERYRTAIEHSNDGVTIVQGNQHLFVNQKFMQIFGYDSPEEIVGKPLSIVVHPDSLKWVEENTLRRQKGQVVPSRYEFKGIRKNGEPVDIEVSATQTVYRGEAVTLAYLRDITERKRAEKEMAQLQEQFRQSQKMEAIGQLAGGVAHDFNNLLTVIKGYSRLSLNEIKEGDPLRENIEEIQNASQRAEDLTRQLLAFSRKQVLQPEVLELNTLISNMNKMLRRLIGEDVELVTVFTEDLDKVKTDPGQIEQVIINLAINARDAMPNGGRLTIETANTELDEEYASTHINATPGRYVMLSVSDTGIGMTQEVMEHIFEPFFTTKEKNKGTGLGLSTVYGIIKQSEGHIWVDSEPGRGTTFKIYLPTTDEDANSLSMVEISTKSFEGSETILIVEDEEVVRKVAAVILQKKGYHIIEAKSGEEALHLIQDQNRNRFDLMLTDVVMPGMKGPELAQHLTSLHPAVKVLYMSGHTDHAILNNDLLKPGTPYLQKPFTSESLACKIREVLDS